MKSEIEHLPAKQQGELGRITQLLMDEFARSIERATMEWKRNGKILKIVLFGSYARSDWVDEPDNGYQSDFDLLIVVSHEDLTDIADHWYIAEDKILRVQGLAASSLYDKDHPFSPLNRRISIIVMNHEAEDHFFQSKQVEDAASAAVSGEAPPADGSSQRAESR